MSWRWSGRLFVGTALVLLAACGKTQHAGNPDAAVAAPEAMDGGTAGASAMAPNEAGAHSPPEAPTGGFTSIAIDSEGRCPLTRSGLVVRSAERIMVTTGCGFYAVDTTTKNVVQLDTRGDTIDDDDQTVAEIGSKLGLSVDGGTTFDWIDWNLARCQGTPQLTAGDGFAVVTCVAGVGVWRGPGGTTFEKLQPSGAVPISAVAAAHGPSFVVQEFDGWFVSTDKGSMFGPFAIDGLPDQADSFAMEIVGPKLFVPAPSGSGTGLFAGLIEGGGFTPVEGFPEVNGRVSLGYGGGNLVARAGTQFLLSRDGESFTPLPIEGFSQPDVAAKYVDDHLYVVTEGVLYVAKVR